MEKRSRRRTRDLVTQAASQGLSENEIGCARISMMARNTNAPCKGRIQMRKTYPLHLFTSGLQRTAGPYSWVKPGHRHLDAAELRSGYSLALTPAYPPWRRRGGRGSTDELWAQYLRAERHPPIDRPSGASSGCSGAAHASLKARDEIFPKPGRTSIRSRASSASVTIWRQQ
jgi:hypothetical protein